MKTVIHIISEKITEAIQKATGQNIPAIVTAATDARFGDYQSNSALSLAKQLKANPRQLAEKIIANLEIDDICQTPEIAGAGFINLRLKPEFVANSLSSLKLDTENFGIEKNQTSKTVVVDFSGPNIAKQMHVGHLRSTIIGDSICRILKQAGWNVIPQNHIGDWGLQMGMLLAISEELKKQNTNINVQEKLDTLEDSYKQANQKFKDDASFAEKSRKATYTLQNHNASSITQWQGFRKITLDACNEIYKLLSVCLTDSDVRGESYYTEKLPAVVEDLKKAGLAVESDGAICVFPEGFKTKEGNPMPFIIQKSDGAFLYATTDLAALRFRVDELKADEIIYVTDARQKLHFEM
ncbi:MAG TPA: arginine--tRNA ligase, partial [Phycisphaerales bacterium]|nr:arginine--tRNA ligase [Phycisphaerales bacterium]